MKRPGRAPDGNGYRMFDSDRCAMHADELTTSKCDQPTDSQSLLVTPSRTTDRPTERSTDHTRATAARRAAPHHAGTDADPSLRCIAACRNRCAFCSRADLPCIVSYRTRPRDACTAAFIRAAAAVTHSRVR